MTQFWKDHWPHVNGHQDPAPLSSKKVVPRNGSSADLQLIPWLTLLAGVTYKPSDPSTPEKPGKHNAPPSLDLEGSERLLDTVQILRKWDVNSFLARAKNLAVHRGGFCLSYGTSRPYVLAQGTLRRIPDETFHKTTGIYLGSGHAAAGYGYATYICFPRMSSNWNLVENGVSKLGVWLDKILIPAVAATLETGNIGQYPRSYQEVQRKFQAFDPRSPAWLGRPINVSADIPEDCLEAFWANIVRFCLSAKEFGFQGPHSCDIGNKLETCQHEQVSSDIAREVQISPRAGVPGRGALYVKRGLLY